MNLEPWIKTKSDEKAIEEGCTFDIKHAERVRTFLLKFCRQSIGEFSGKPLELLDWQWLDLVAPLYGWRRPDGSRRFRSAGIWVPKNNGKSTLCSGLSLYHLVADNEPGAQVVNIASTKEQADIVYRGVYDMVLQSPTMISRKNGKLSKDGLLWLRANIQAIECNKTRSVLRVMSGEDKGSSGHPISFMIFDELAEQANRYLFDNMAHNLTKRRNSLLISISTAGFKRESIGFEQFVYAKRVLSGEHIDTNFLPVIYEAKPEQDWKTLETFKSCNPSYPHTIRENDVTSLLTAAINEPRKEAAYKTLRLNIWTGFSTNWISSNAWDACYTPFDEKEFYGSKVYVGWDYGYKHDLCSYCLIVKKDDLIYLLPRFFIPAVMAEQKIKKDHVPYNTWKEKPATNLYYTDGDVIDPKFVRSKLLEDSKNFRIEEIGYDPTGLEESRQICEEDHGWNMVAVPQKPRYIGPAAAYLERLILAGQIRHNNNPILSWCLGNCATKVNADGLFVYKGQGETQRIDGVIAAIIGLSRQMTDTPFDGEWIISL